MGMIVPKAVEMAIVHDAPEAIPEILYPLMVSGEVPRTFPSG